MWSDTAGEKEAKPIGHGQRKEGSFWSWRIKQRNVFSNR